MFLENPKYPFSLLLALLGMLLLSGCDQPPTSKILAHVGEEVITEADFAEEITLRLSRGRNLATPAILIQEMIERKAMLQQAKASSIMQDPEMIRDLDNRILSQWLNDTLKQEQDTLAITDEELQAKYEESKEVFTTPALTRIAVLVRKFSSPHPSDVEIAELEQALRTAVETFNADRMDATGKGRLPGFGKVAANTSEDTVSRYRGGDLGWLDLEAGSARCPQIIVDAIANLEEGVVSPIIRTETGLYVAMKDGFRPTVTVSLSEISTSMKRRLLREKKQLAEHTFKQRVLEKVEISVDQDAVATLQIPQQPKPRSNTHGPMSIPTL